MTTPTTPIFRSDRDRAKWAAARYAAQTYCFDGARLGLGSGSTSHYFVYALATRVRDGLRVTGVPTSTATRGLALSLGITLIDLDDTGHLDVCNGIASDLVIGEPDGTATAHTFPLTLPTRRATTATAGQ